FADRAREGADEIVNALDATPDGVGAADPLYLCVGRYCGGHIVEAALFLLGYRGRIGREAALGDDPSERRIGIVIVPPIDGIEMRAAREGRRAPQERPVLVPEVTFGKRTIERDRSVAAATELFDPWSRLHHIPMVSSSVTSA